METKDGFLVINKDKGFTSHDCVKQIRKLLNTKKVGHTGTLDPEVIGTLPIAIGSATRFIQYLPQEKTYIGQIKLGIRTKTDDVHGEIINKKSWPKISDEKLDKYLDQFRGIIKQIPPKVSSVHVNGERAYKKSFKNENFDLAPREVKIDELILIKWNQMNGIIELKIKCSADIEKEKGKKNAPNFIIPTISALNHISTFTLTKEEQINFWQTGRAIRVDINYLNKSKAFDHKKPIKVIDKRKTLQVLPG